MMQCGAVAVECGAGVGDQMRTVILLLEIRRPRRSSPCRSSAASDVYKRQAALVAMALGADFDDTVECGLDDFHAPDALLLQSEALGGLLVAERLPPGLVVEVPLDGATEPRVEGVLGLPAEVALDFGLINKIVPAGKTLEVAKEYAAKICANGPLAVRAVTRSLREHQECMSEEDAMLASDELANPVFASSDAREGMRAFKEKRKAKFTGE